VLAALVYAALAAHLLFIPYAFSPLSFDEGLRRFLEIHWLVLGSDQNVALVSRALMWIPLGALLAASIAPQPGRRIELLALFVATLLGCVWAIAVTFAQLWFPGRTFSLNNLVAEACGVIVGALLWSTFGAPGLRWWRQLASGGRISLHAALGGYVVLYLAASLTPYDFVTGVDELSEKLASDLYGPWLAPIGCGPSPCELKLLSVALATLPCGWWFASQRPGERHVWLPAVLMALVVATMIEALHFLMVSGVSQGASIVVRAAGMALGVATFSGQRWLTQANVDRFGRPAVLAMLVPYMIAVAYVGGWFRAERIGILEGLARLDDVIWQPFAYQYFAPYQSTMISTMVHVALYAPVGVMCWLWIQNRDRVQLWVATLLAAVLAFVAETSKIFLAGHHPDYADVFIAAVSATLALTILRFVSRTGQGVMGTPFVR